MHVVGTFIVGARATAWCARFEENPHALARAFRRVSSALPTRQARVFEKASVLRSWWQRPLLTALGAHVLGPAKAYRWLEVGGEQRRHPLASVYATARSLLELAARLAQPFGVCEQVDDGCTDGLGRAKNGGVDARR